MSVVLYLSCVLMMLCLQRVHAEHKRHRARKAAKAGKEESAKTSRFLLLVLGLVPAAVMLASCLTGILLSAFAGQSTPVDARRGFELVASNVVGAPGFLGHEMEVSPVEGEMTLEVLETVFALSLVAMVATSSSARAIKDRLAPTCGGLLRLVFLYMPGALFAELIILGLALKLKETWTFQEASYYVADTACGLSVRMTDLVPDTSMGSLFAIFAGSVALSMRAVTAGVVAMHPATQAALRYLEGPAPDGSQEEGPALAHELCSEVVVAVLLAGGFASIYGAWPSVAGSVKAKDNLTMFLMLASGILILVVSLVAYFRAVATPRGPQPGLRRLRAGLTLAVVVFAVVPATLLSGSLIIGSLITMLEDWDVPTGFEYILANAAGLGSTLTEVTPDTRWGTNACIVGCFVGRLIGASCMGLVAATSAVRDLTALAPASFCGLLLVVLLFATAFVLSAGAAVAFAANAARGWAFAEGFRFAVSRICSLGAGGHHHRSFSMNSLPGQLFGLSAGFLALPLGGALIGLLSVHHPAREALALFAGEDSDDEEPALGEGKHHAKYSAISGTRARLGSSGSGSGSGTPASEGGLRPWVPLDAAFEDMPDSLESQAYSSLRGWDDAAAAEAAAASPAQRARALREQLESAMAELNTLDLRGLSWADQYSMRAEHNWRVHHLQQELYPLECQGF